MKRRINVPSRAGQGVLLRLPEDMFGQTFMWKPINGML